MFGLDSPAAAALLIILAALSLALLCFRLRPERFVRALNWVLVHSVYRVRLIGAERVPATGGALIVCNHVSFVDPALLLGSLSRPIRFLMYRPLYEAPLFHPFARAMKAIPIAGSDGREKVAAALAEARERIDNGELVAIFAEGGITRTGQMLPFRAGLETIMQGAGAPIIPAYLDQVWGSIFSFAQGKFLWKFPRELPYPVTVAFGPALPPGASAFEVRQAVQELGAESFSYRRSDFKNTLQGMLRSVRRGPNRSCAEDSFGEKCSYLELLAAALDLARQLERSFPAARRIAVIGRPSAATLAANAALSLAKREAVNLDAADEPQLLKKLLEVSRPQAVIAAGKEAEKKCGELQLQFLPVAELARCGPAKKLRAYWRAVSDRRPNLEQSAPAAVVFSRGRTGDRKAVLLSHGNICSNVESIYDVLQLRRSDVMGVALPAPNAFSLTLGIWLPLLAGIRVVYHYDQADAAGFAEQIRRGGVSLLLLSPPALASLAERASEAQLASVRQVFVGGDEVCQEAVERFQQRFRIPVFEGYGAAELSPMALVNVPDYDYGKGRQVGRKPGSAGHPLPGVAVRVVDPAALQPLPPGEKGLLLVRGPNVMLGYLHAAAGAGSAVNGGWFNTGDWAQLDHDGFVTIFS